MNYPNRIFTKIQVTLLAIFVVGCTCLPFSSPPSKTPIAGTLSYSDILTYIGTNVKSDPKWSGWSGTADESQPLNYSITPASPYVTINQETGEITVLAKELFSNNYTVTVNGYGDFEERVSTTLSVEVRPPFLYNVYNVSDDSNLELDHSLSVATTLMGETTYLFVTGDMDYGVSVFSVGNDGSLVNVTNILDDKNLNLRNPTSTAISVVGGVAYLFVSGFFDNGFSVFSMSEDGFLSNITNVSDNDKMKIGGPKGVITAKVENTNYLFVAGGSENGIGVFSVESGGSLNNVYNVSDTNALNLKGIWSMSITEIGGTTYLFAAGVFDDGVSVFAVGNDGSLRNVDNVSDDTSLELDGAKSVPTAVVGETNYLFVTGWGDSGVSVFSIDSDGSLDNVHNVSDDDTMNISNTTAATVAVVKGTTYLLVGGYVEGLSAFSVEDDGSLKHIYRVSDSADLELSGIFSLTTAKVGETDYLFVPGHTDHGVSVFSINP